MKTIVPLAAICLALCVVLPGQTDALFSSITGSASASGGTCGLSLLNGIWHHICDVTKSLPVVGKKDEIEERGGLLHGVLGGLNVNAVVHAVIKPFSYRCPDYDKNGDGNITFLELRAVLSDVSKGDCLKLFVSLDLNLDNILTCGEFIKAKVKLAA